MEVPRGVGDGESLFDGHALSFRRARWESPACWLYNVKVLNVPEPCTCERGGWDTALRAPSRNEDHNQRLHWAGPPPPRRPGALPPPARVLPPCPDQPRPHPRRPGDRTAAGPSQQSLCPPVHRELSDVTMAGPRGRCPGHRASSPRALGVPALFIVTCGHISPPRRWAWTTLKTGGFCPRSATPAGGPGPGPSRWNLSGGQAFFESLFPGD